MQAKSCKKRQEEWRRKACKTRSSEFKDLEPDETGFRFRLRPMSSARDIKGRESTPRRLIQCFVLSPRGRAHGQQSCNIWIRFVIGQQQQQLE